MKPITLADIGPDSTPAMLTHLALAVKHIPHRWSGTAYENAEDYFRERMTHAEHLAFDCFLVRMKDPLGCEPGSTRHRFSLRVSRMAELARCNS